MPDGESILGSMRNGQKVIIEDGVAKMPDRSAFAGSVATVDRLIRTMATIAQVPVNDAVTMMTSTPSRIIGVDSRKASFCMEGIVNILAKLEGGSDFNTVSFPTGDLPRGDFCFKMISTGEGPVEIDGF